MFGDIFLWQTQNQRILRHAPIRDKSVFFDRGFLKRGVGVREKIPNNPVIFFEAVSSIEGLPPESGGQYHVLCKTFRRVLHLPRKGNFVWFFLGCAQFAEYHIIYPILII